MKSNVKNITKTLCDKLQFLRLYEVFTYFLRPTQSPCKLLIYNNIAGGGVFLFKKKFTTVYIQNKMFMQKNILLYLL
jgi:hypothetical protein